MEISLSSASPQPLGPNKYAASCATGLESISGSSSTMVSTAKSRYCDLSMPSSVSLESAMTLSRTSGYSSLNRLTTGAVMPSDHDPGRPTESRSEETTSELQSLM